MREEVKSLRQQEASTTPVVLATESLKPLPAIELAEIQDVEDVGDRATQDDSATIVATEEPQQFTREELGKILGCSRETIRKWQTSGELERQGWVVVPETGSSPKNPFRYRHQPD